MSSNEEIYLNVFKSKFGTPESRARLIEVLRIAHDPKLTFQQALEKVRATRKSPQATSQATDKEPNKP